MLKTTNKASLRKEYNKKIKNKNFKKKLFEEVDLTCRFGAWEGCTLTPG